jgi:hypothetical protein
MEDAPVECDDFQLAVYMNGVECEKHKNLLRLRSKTTFSMWYLLKSSN